MFAQNPPLSVDWEAVYSMKGIIRVKISGWPEKMDNIEFTNLNAFTRRLHCNAIKLIFIK